MVCVWASFSHFLPWWSRSPAAPTVSLASGLPPRNERALQTHPPIPATRTRTGTPPLTCQRGGTAASNAHLIWTCSRQRRSWKERRGSRRGSESSGRSGWTGNLIYRGRGASTGITEDCWGFYFPRTLTWLEQNLGGTWNGKGQETRPVWSFISKNAKRLTLRTVKGVADFRGKSFLFAGLHSPLGIISCTAFSMRISFLSPWQTLLLASSSCRKQGVKGYAALPVTSAGLFEVRIYGWAA